MLYLKAQRVVVAAVFDVAIYKKEKRLLKFYLWASGVLGLHHPDGDVSRDFLQDKPALARGVSAV